MAKAKAKRPHRNENTAERLVEAAAKEFQEHGFSGTDTNRIARRAGFAPQTFYRWFEDKTDIFVAVYQKWIGEEFKQIDKLRAEKVTDDRLVKAVIAHHRAYHIFRRSLRLLTVENDRVRAARAASRLEQIARIKARYRPRRISTAQAAIFLLQYERLCDAVADGELNDLGVDQKAVEIHLARLYREIRKTR